MNKPLKIMNKLRSLLLITITCLFIFSSCSKDDEINDKNPITENSNKYVNDWIFEEMNIYYLWNDLITKKPEFDFNPNKFFDSLLNKYDKINDQENN